MITKCNGVFFFLILVGLGARWAPVAHLIGRWSITDAIINSSNSSNSSSSSSSSSSALLNIQRPDLLLLPVRPVPATGCDRLLFDGIYLFIRVFFFFLRIKKKETHTKQKKTLPTWTNKSYQDSISNRTWLVITNSSWSTPWAAHSTREPLTIDPTLPIKIFLHEEERKKTLFIDWEPIFHSASRWCWVVHWRHLIYARSKAPHDEIMQENHGMEVEK